MSNAFCILDRHPTERLEHAPDSMIQVQAERRHGHNIEYGYGPDGKPGQNILVHHQVLELAGLEAHEAAGKMQEVENNKGRQQQAAPAHRYGAPGCFDILSSFVSHRAGAPIHSGKLDGSCDMEEHAHEKHDPDEPKKLSVPELRPTYFAKKSRVGVNFFGAGKNLEVTDHVSDDEQDEHRARYRHHNFFADHACPDRNESIACACVLSRLCRFCHLATPGL